MKSPDLKERVLQLMSSPSFMPMRKRGLAKALDISDEEYRGFKELLEEMSAEREIAELKKGKYGLPPAAEHSRSKAAAHPKKKKALSTPDEVAEVFTARHPPALKELVPEL